MPGSRGVLLIAISLASARPGAAQPGRQQVLIDAVYASRALWRGVPRVSSPVTQIAGTAALEIPNGHIAFGVWSLIELHGPETGEYSITGSDQGLGEVDYTLQYASRQGRFDITAGVSHYSLQNEAPIGTLPTDFSSTELYASASLREGLLRSIGITPTLRTWYDVDEVVGTYAEFELSYAMPPVPLERVGIHLSARTGLSLGQSTADGATGYFDEDGFTHIETLLLVTGQPLPWLWLGFNWRVSFGLDPATRREDPRSSSANRSSWGWIESWITLRLPGRSW